jgi:hypothetical protein
MTGQRASRGGRGPLGARLRALREVAEDTP